MVEMGGIEPPSKICTYMKSSYTISGIYVPYSEYIQGRYKESNQQTQGVNSPLT